MERCRKNKNRTLEEIKEGIERCQEKIKEKKILGGNKRYIEEW